MATVALQPQATAKTAIGAGSTTVSSETPPPGHYIVVTGLSGSVAADPATATGQLRFLVGKGGIGGVTIYTRYLSAVGGTSAGFDVQRMWIIGNPGELVAAGFFDAPAGTGATSTTMHYFVTNQIG